VICPPGVATVQRNPHFLWLAEGSLAPSSVDQCLDALPGSLDFAPFKLCGENIQVGDIYTTWTYLGVSREDLRQRLNSEPPIGGRCGADFVAGRDTLRTFPTRSFQLLVKFEVRIERAVDELRWFQGETQVGHYGTANDGTLDIVKFKISMLARGLGGDTPVQYLELYYARNIGEVIRLTGANVDTRSTSRLKTATVNGAVYPPSFFGYVE
jgi:hypothetical protein